MFITYLLYIFLKAKLCAIFTIIAPNLGCTLSQATSDVRNFPSANWVIRIAFRLSGRFRILLNRTTYSSRNRLNFWSSRFLGTFWADFPCNLLGTQIEVMAFLVPRFCWDFLNLLPPWFMSSATNIHAAWIQIIRHKIRSIE